MTWSRTRWLSAACEAFYVALWEVASLREGLLGWTLSGLAMFY